MITVSEQPVAVQLVVPMTTRPCEAELREMSKPQHLDGLSLPLRDSRNKSTL
jgi:hypothetical protein